MKRSMMLFINASMACATSKDMLGDYLDSLGI